VSQQRCQELKGRGDKLFEAKRPLDSLHQTLAENFYPMRADFTRQRWLSEEFYSYIMSSRPMLAHRELANSISAILRPRNMQWFKPKTGRDKIDKDTAASAWLEYAGAEMRTAMYDRVTQFVRATKEGDNDYILTGQCIIEVRKNALRDNVFCRCWHVRDCVWAESGELAINEFHLRQKIQARNLVRRFPATASPELQRRAAKDPFYECEIREIVLSSDEYDAPNEAMARPDGKRGSLKHPFHRICIDIEHNSILYETPVRWLGFVIPRWVTIGGFSQYAYSPTALVALPDGRMLQQMTLTLLEIGQKIVDPPLLSAGDVIQGGTNLGAGQITYIDPDYDERTGEALRALEFHPEGLQWGTDWHAKVESVVQEAFFLNVLNLPPLAEGDKMTAFEVQERMKEYIRRATPLFEPMDTEYNGQLCSAIFDELMMMRRLGPWEDIPPVLRNQDIQFGFVNPLVQAEDEQTTMSFTKLSQLLGSAMQLQPSLISNVDIDTGFRDAVPGTGAKAKWLRSPDDARKMALQVQQQHAAEQQAAQLGQVADSGAKLGNAAKNVGDAASSLQDAGVM
jgi:hypothetical protein